MFDGIVSELLGHVEAQGAVLVVQAALVGVAQRGVGAVDLLEPLGGRWVIGVLVRVVLESQFPVGWQWGDPRCGFTASSPGTDPPRAPARKWDPQPHLPG